MRELHCAHLLPAADAPVVGAHTIRIDGDRIAAVEAGKPASRRLLALPALVNAHDHARVTSTTAYGGAGKPLETWIPYLALLPSVDPYLAAAVSLSRSALGGAGAVMVHYTRVQGLTDLPTEVAEVARAAGDVGVRVGFAVAMRNRNPLVYGPSEPVLAALSPQAREEIRQRFLRPPLSVDAQIALVDAVAEAAANPMFDVQYGPQAVQWCTHELLEAIARASERTGRRIHMHLLETSTQRAWLDANYPGGILKFLDGIGLPESAAHARALHLGAPRRTGIDRRTGCDDLGQHQLEPPSAVGHRAAQGDGQARLPGGARPRRLDVRRGRRCAPRNATGPSAAPGHRVHNRRRPPGDAAHGVPDRPPLGHQQGRRRRAGGRRARRHPGARLGCGRCTSACGRTSIRAISCSRAPPCVTSTS